MPSFFENVAGGAASGSVAGPYGAAIGAGVSLLPEVFKLFSGRKQIRDANKINPVLPAFQANSGIVDNARQLQDRSGNYQMAGYGQAIGNINQSGATAFNRGVQGASSSGDVLDLATRINAGTGANLNQLAGQNAAGAEQALMQYQQANAMAGNELVRKNMYDMDQYNQQLAQKAALLQAGNQNQFSAGDNIANGIRYFTQPQQQLIQPGTKGSISPYGSIYG